MKKKNKILYIGIFIISILLILIFIILVFPKKQENNIPIIPQPEETVEHQKIIVQETPKQKQDYVPQTRDTYIHFESVPNDGLYETITETDSLNLTKVSEPIIKSLINKMYTQQKYTSIEYTTDYQTQEAHTYWFKLDDYYWRFKYFIGNQKVTADGAMGDFIFASEASFDKVYQENELGITDINHEIVISMINKIKTLYQYDTAKKANITWAWDAEDENNHKLFTYIVKFTNSKYEDLWVITYYQDTFIEAHRDIVGIE